MRSFVNSAGQRCRSMELVKIRNAIWSKDEQAIRLVRESVFVVEQNVPEELDFDGLDGRCRHVLAFNDADEPIGTGRIMADGHIGRVVVLREWRGQGVGVAIMRALIDLAAGDTSLYLHSQDHAVGFYERLGFIQEGLLFMDAGIPHRKMIMERGED